MDKVVLYKAGQRAGIYFDVFENGEVKKCTFYESVNLGELLYVERAVKMFLANTDAVEITFADGFKVAKA